MSRIAENIARIRGELAGLCPDAPPRIMAVTKTQPPEAVLEAVAAGVDLVGENRVQELIEKYGALSKAEVHFIGRLQQNKVKYIVDKVTMIHSVDSLALAREIGRRSLQKGVVMDVLCQVNIGREVSKGGVLPEDAADFCREMCSIGGLRLRGLMTVPPETRDPAGQAVFFQAMRGIYIDIQAQRLQNSLIDTLSMGMSGDYPAAARQGATILRLGTAIFGRRE